jgi:hypothetical protein
MLGLKVTVEEYPQQRNHCGSIFGFTLRLVSQNINRVL